MIKLQLKDKLAYQGMTLREYYAGLAMQGMLASPFCEQNMRDRATGRINFMAKLAVEQADALIAELEKSGAALDA